MSVKPSRQAAGGLSAPASSFWLSLLLLSLLPACSSPRADAFLGVVTPYKVEVVQGNVITREQVEQVRVGMSRAQVRDVLGSPMVADIFHDDRWDYVFTIRRPGAPPQQRNVIVRFEGERLKSMDAPDLPAERDFVASIDTAKPVKNPPSLSLTPEQLKALPAPAAPATPSPASTDAPPTGPARTYPPLEPR